MDNSLVLYFVVSGGVITSSLGISKIDLFLIYSNSIYVCYSSILSYDIIDYIISVETLTFILKWFLILLALDANFNVLIVSSRLELWDEHVTI